MRKRKNKDQNSYLRDVEGWLETIEIMSDKEAMRDIRQAEKELKQGKFYSFEEVFGKKVDKRTKKKFSSKT